VDAATSFSEDARMTHPGAGTPAPPSELLDVAKLLRAYDDIPDSSVVEQRVAFGTSGHRGSAFARSFNDAHLAAIAQAIAEQRAAAGIAGPLFLGADTHALSDPAQRTLLEVLVANGVDVAWAGQGSYVPTPVVSHAILRHNRARGDSRLADGILVTPSHNPPEDGGVKYNPPHGGPADTDVTKRIEARANDILSSSGSGVRRLDLASALGQARVVDLVGPYVEDLGSAIDLPAIAKSGLRIGVDPLGGAGIACWDRVAERWGLALTVVRRTVDPTFGFMPRDHDGKIRMDCSSPYAMRALVAQKDAYDIAFGNDADADRHGIVTHDGLVSPNAYLAVAIDYLVRQRSKWSSNLRIGKTLVSSALIDRVAADVGRAVVEVPVGFKWFVDGLTKGTLAFGGEESAGASFLRMDGSVWTTDKDGLLLGLLAAEMQAVTGKSPSERYRELEAKLGSPVYRRVDRPATREQKRRLGALAPSDVAAATLAGSPILERLIRATGNDAPIGGLKVTTADGWFAARPSGTEDIYKIYAESFRGEAHLDALIDEASVIVGRALG
jgi:phosphoglucomutase